MDQAATIEQGRAAGRWRVIVANRAWERLPSADILYGCDNRWWDQNAEATAANFSGERWTRNPESAAKYGLRWIRSAKGQGLAAEGDVINEGGNSGYQIIGLAYLFGARRIFLVGYDMQLTGGQPHYFGKHPKGLSNPANFDGWIARFGPLADDLAAAGVAVTNCTTHTALHCFQRGAIDDALAASSTNGQRCTESSHD